MQQYKDLVQRVLERGEWRSNRTGTPTQALFAEHVSFDLQDGFPLLTTKEVSWKNVLIENLWFLSGADHVEFLRKHNCKFWEPWTGPDGRVPSAYGYFWRRWASGELRCDQVAELEQSLKTNPASRRHVLTAWNPPQALRSNLPPCHAFSVFSVSDEGRQLDLHLTQRSADIALGIPYNWAGYAFLMHLFARFANLRPGRFSHLLVDAHIYRSDPPGAASDHAPKLLEQCAREARPLPRLSIDARIQSLADVDALIRSNPSTETLLQIFQLEGYDPHPAITFKVAV